jgi:hypothetical protein
MCLSFHMAKKIIKKIMNATIESYEDLYRQLLVIVLVRNPFFMIKVSTLTQDFITWEIVLQIRKLKSSM